MSLSCVMVVGWKVDARGDGPGDEIVCGKPARRLCGDEVGCCDDCFEAMVTCDDFTREECEHDYPLAAGR